jgi:hypothetical protein
LFSKQPIAKYCIWNIKRAGTITLERDCAPRSKSEKYTYIVIW